MAAQYRVQMSNHQGIVRRAFGGRCASWSPWRTLKSFPTLEAAQAAMKRCAATGLSRYRVMLGKNVVASSY